MRKIDKISIHCSDTSAGSALSYDKYHRLHNGWSQIGYNFVISNGNSGDGYMESIDGSIEVGRPIGIDPAAVKYFNNGMIAICLTGANYEDFTQKQFKSLEKLLKDLIDKYGIKLENIKGHRDYSTKKHPIYKKCPCFDVKTFLQQRKIL